MLSPGASPVAPSPPPAAWSKRPGERLEGVVQDGTIASSDSAAPFGEPGMLTISVRPRTPTTARLSAANGVFARPSARIASAMPGTS